MKKLWVLSVLFFGLMAAAQAQDFPRHIMVKSESGFLQKLNVEIDMGDTKRYPERKEMEKQWERHLGKLKSHVAMVEFFENMGYEMMEYNIVRDRVDGKQNTMDHTHYFWFTLSEEASANLAPNANASVEEEEDGGR